MGFFGDFVDIVILFGGVGVDVVWFELVFIDWVKVVFGIVCCVVIVCMGVFFVVEVGLLGWILSDDVLGFC